MFEYNQKYISKYIELINRDTTQKTFIHTCKIIRFEKTEYGTFLEIEGGENLRVKNSYESIVNSFFKE